jgi:branched-chain amino acid transport system permease protein
MSRTLSAVLAYVVAMAAICAALTWGQPHQVVGLFLVSGLAVGSLYALGGICLVVLYRSSGVLNFASGAVGAFGVMLAWQLGQWGWPQPLTWLAAILAATALSSGYGRLIAPRLAWRDPVVKAVATLGFALVILGATSFVWRDEVRKFSLPSDETAIVVLGLRVTLTRLIVILSAIGIATGVWAFLAATRVGLQMRALANSRDLSALIGIPILKVETIAWIVTGAIAGFTGLMFGDLVRLEPAVLTFMVIPSIAAAICGRLENLGLVLLGGLSIGVIESLLTLQPQLKSVRSIAPFVLAALLLIWMQRGRRLTFAGDV